MIWIAESAIWRRAFCLIATYDLGCKVGNSSVNNSDDDCLKVKDGEDADAGNCGYRCSETLFELEDLCIFPFLLPDEIQSNNLFLERES